MIKRIVGFFESELPRLCVGTALFVIALVFSFLELEIVASLLYISALLVSGLAVFISAVKGIMRRDLLDEKFLMSVASIGAMIIGDMSEGVAVMLFFLLGEFFEHKAVRRSRNSIKALMSIRPDEATVILDGAETVMDAEDVEIGSTVVIRSGERVPIDSRVISGFADIDTSMLTGESLPRSVSEGDLIESGTVVIGGVIYAVTERAAEESSAQRILDLVENATENKSKEESFITVFSRFYTPIVVSLALLMAVLPPIITDTIGWGESVYRALTFLVISCPCALVISVPMAFFGGIGGAAASGILFKGGNVFSALAKADTFAFDKTGTLTTGEISITEIETFDIDEERLRYLAAGAEYGSNHPISRAVRSLSEDAPIPTETLEIAGKGIFARVDGVEVLVGNRALMAEYGVEAPVGLSEGILISVSGRLCGVLHTGDRIREGAKKSIKSLKSDGVKLTVMLSGDRFDRAAAIGSEVGIDEIYGDLLPDDKYAKLQNIIDLSKKTVYVGDGINDSPALSASDVGIAMGGIGSDSAIEAADIVIMNDDPTKIPLARKIAKKTVRIAKENIVFALGVKGLILVLSALGYANMWLAVFADVGVAVIAILNSMRTLIVSGKKK